MGHQTTRTLLEYMLFLLGVYATSMGLVPATLLWALLYFLLRKL